MEGKEIKDSFVCVEKTSSEDSLERKIIFVGLMKRNGKHNYLLWFLAGIFLIRIQLLFFLLRLIHNEISYKKKLGLEKERNGKK